MFDDCTNLRPWKGAAEILAKDDSWGTLYDLEQLSKNEVKVSAVTYVAQREKHHHKKEMLTSFFKHRYFNDMYVDFDLAQETASKITEQYITNQLMHNGIL
jgi:hypothetical protein